jgi:hypothetical protein
MTVPGRHGPPGRPATRAPISRIAASTAVVAAVLAASGTAFAQAEPGAGEDNASCLGLGSSFYGQFAPQQRAFVALFVNDRKGAAGEYYVVFAPEKESGTIPAPCGTRIE